MFPNTDITLQEPQAEAEELEAQASIAAPSRQAIGGRIVRGAAIIMAGTILSRLLGLGRESTISYFFGAGAQVDAFTVANHIATILYDLLISGSVSAALVPVFSELANDEKRRPEFGRLIGTILTLAGIFLLAAVVALEALAGPLAGFMSGGLGPQTQELAVELTRWVLPAVFFMGLSGVVMAAHYALGRFVYPAFTSSVFNAAIIVSAIVLSGVIGVRSLVLGIVVGAFGMVALQAPGLRDIPVRLNLDLGNPAVRRILKLYAPVAVSVAVSSGALIIDRSLASQTGTGSISAMRYATTLVQFGLGMVSAAISLAALPSLSQHFSNHDAEAYKRTLAAGLRLVTVLVLPVAAGLFALAVPLTALIFRHGAYNAADQQLTILALLFYVPGLPFGAIDQVLIFAFYARKNTLTPTLIGIAAVGVYLVIALSSYRTWGMPGLVVANSAQLAFHALVTGTLLWRVMRNEGGLRGYGIGEVMLKAGGAAIVLALASYGTWQLLERFIHVSSLATEVVLLSVPALVGGGLYAGLVWMMRLPEVELVASKVRSRLKR